MRIAENGKIPSEYWYHDPTIQDKYGFTVAMYLAQNGIIPPQQWIHDKDMQNNYGFTVQDFLQSNNIQIPAQWKTVDCGIENNKILKQLIKYCEEYNIDYQTIIQNPEQQNDVDKYTFAMYLADNSIIPQKQFLHDPDEKDYNNKTVRQKLQLYDLPIPNEWYDDQYKKNNKFKPDCVNNAFYGILTERDENVNPETQYENGWTVAMIYASQGIMPPKQWEHNSTIQDKHGQTIAMLLAKNKICDIPQQWYHNPELQNNYGSTVAMYLVYKCIIPPKQWQHNPYIPNEDEKNVQYYLIQNKIVVPEQWKIVNRQIQISDQIQQQLENYCQTYIIENQQIIINYPQYQKYKRIDTFAVYLELNGIQTPKEFQYNPQYRLFKNQTTSMIIAYKGKIPSTCWHHDPLLTDDNGNTVAIILSSKGIIPPQQWMHDINIKNNKNQSIKSNLLQNYYIYYNDKFIKINKNNFNQYIQTEILDNTCQICLNDEEQEFIKTNCIHKICLQCFKETFKANNYQKCPICRQYNWFKINEQSQ